MSEKICPFCGSAKIGNHGRHRDGSPRLQCRECGKCWKAAQKKCAVCGAEIPRERYRSNTCSEECYRERQRERWINHYYRLVAQDPEHNAKKRARRDLALEAVYSKKKWVRVKSDPQKHESERERQKRHHAAHKQQILARRKAWEANLSDEHRAEASQRSRERARLYQRKKRRGMDNTTHQKYLADQANRRRLRALAKLQSEMAALAEKIEKENPDGK